MIGVTGKPSRLMLVVSWSVFAESAQLLKWGADAVS